MKRLFALTLLLPLAASAQTPGSCGRSSARAELSLSDVRASLYNNGALFFGTDGSQYTVPKLGDAGSMFSAAIWFGGTVAGAPRTAAASYGNWELWPGPLDAGATLPDPSDCSAYDRIWRVDRLDIAAYESGGTPARDLADWPVGLGAASVDASGTAIVTTDRDRTLDLDAGERPLVYGTETAFWVMNDVGNEHQSTGSAPLGIEVRMTAFSVASDDAALSTATFYRVETVNRSAASIDGFHVGFYADHDLGNYSDDYIGSDAERGMLYAYNGDNDDDGSTGYGVAPPASGIDVLSGGWGAMRYETDFFGLIEVSPIGVYRNLQAVWSDGVPLTRGGIGHNPGAPDPVRWVYDGAPETRSFWTEVDESDAPGEQPATPSDRRALLSAQPVTLAPGASHTVDFGVLHARGADHLASVGALRTTSDAVQALYDDGSLFTSGATPNLIAAPVPVSPSAGELVSGDAPIPLAWSASPGAVQYVVQISDRADFQSYTTEITDGLSVTLRPEIADEPVPVFWRVRGEADGAISPLSEVGMFSYINLTADFLGQGRGIVEVARPDGPVCADGSDDYGCTRGLGNTVLFNPDISGDYFLTGAIISVTQQIRRNVGAAAPGTYEIRFTADGGLAIQGDQNAFDGFDADADHRVLRVPFEVWALGVTPDDASDDLRMIPIVGDPGEGLTDWTNAFPRIAPYTAATPATESVNGLMPDRPGGYALFEAAALASGGPGSVYVDADVTVMPIDPDAYLVGDRDPSRGEDCAKQGYFISFCYRNDRPSRVLGSGRNSTYSSPISGLVFADLAGDGTTPPAGTVIRFNTTPVGDYIVGAEDAAGEEATALLPVRPNPTRGAAEAIVRLRESGAVRARLVDVLGREVAVLADGERGAGEHRLTVPAGLAAGVYVLTVEVSSSRQAGTSVERFSRTLTVVR